MNITGNHSPAPSPDQSRRRVLVVEEDPDTRRFINRTIGSTFDVVEAATGEEALRSAGDGTYGLLIYDPELPNADPSLTGLRLLIRLCAIMQPIRVLAVSSGDMTEIRESGLFDFLQKPLTTAPMRNTIDRLMMSPAINQAAEVVQRTQPVQTRPAWMGISGVLTFAGSMAMLGYTEVPFGVPVALASFGFMLVWSGPTFAESFARIAQTISSIIRK